MLSAVGAAALALLASADAPWGHLDEAVAPCPPGSQWNGGFCQIVDTPPDDVVTGCNQSEPVILNAPCDVEGFTFYAAQDRYVRALDHIRNERYRPPDGDLSHLGYWAGPADQGWMFEWRKLAAIWSVGAFAWGERGLMWLAEAPGEAPVIIVDPEEVAQQILNGMSFEPLEIGLAPRPLETDPQSIGLVGAPVWMWVTNAGPTTWGPIEESATVGGVTVTVRAEVEQVSWDMGDGTIVTCEEPGDPYSPSLGVRPSPNCGHVYTQTSASYTVTATANWAATWTASTGAEGTLEPPEPATTARVRIGERQVIETG